MFKSILLLSTFALRAIAMNETIDGYNFFLWGPKQDQSKSQYEHDAADVALGLLKETLGSEPLPDLPTDNVAAVLKLKQDLGTEKLKQLLEPDTEDADKFWHDVINKATNKSNPWDSPVSAEAHGVIFLPHLNLTQFAAWYVSKYADEANLAANPEHYVKETTQIASGLTSKILEGWGGVTTNFTFPSFGAPDRGKDPFLPELEDYPIQQAGDKVLRDGTRFGVLHLALRNIPGERYGQPNDGFEVFSTVWYPNGADDDHLDHERRHMIIEIVNLTLQAQKDVENGALSS
ncbi:hypothetical protein F5Y13DRAFT_99167 [Hypoxylon sp. FL1857]|nr:hypothetical protein F5Y13DRAFT_99167 [Hypoxylon sp. FL1857]